MAESIRISYEQMTQGSYVRTGDDLKISTTDLWGETDSVLLKNYFKTSPDLVTLKGSTLKGNIVNLLAVNSQPNTNVAFEDPQAIGKITIAEGTVVVQRLDKFIELKEGDFIYLNDIVDAKAGSVGISFKDQSSISVDPGAKMVIDDFVYDAEVPTLGSMNANIITGNFSFVSGQIAKTGNDAMKVTTPVLTIGVRGTQVAGKANQDGEDNEIVLLPNEDGSVGQVMIANESGQVLLTKPYEATVIYNAYQPPTVPVVLPKTEVLKKFASTIATTRKTEKVASTEREAEEATKEKDEAEQEKEELEEEKEELEDEAEELEEEKEELEEEAEELEEEKEQLEEEAEAIEEEKEQLEEEAEAIAEEKEEIEEKAEKLEEEIAELEEKLEELPQEEKEQIEQELEALEEEIQEVEEIKQEIEEKVLEVEEKFEEVEQKEEFIEEKQEEVEQKVIEVEEKFEEVEQKVIEVEEKFEVVEQKVEVVEQKIVIVEEKFEAIVEEYEVFQEQFIEEFKEFIPEEEIQMFLEEAPAELIQNIQENIVQELKEERAIILNPNEDDIFNEEAVEEALIEIEQQNIELEELAEELIQKDMELQEEVQQLEEEAAELDEKAMQLIEEEKIAKENNDIEALEEIEQQYEEIAEEREEINQGFEQVDEQYQELDEGFQELNEQVIDIDRQIFEVLVEVNDEQNIMVAPDGQIYIEDGPGFNQDDDVFAVPEDQQIDLDVEAFVQEQKELVIQDNAIAEQLNDFFENEEVVVEEDNRLVQDMVVVNAGNIDEFIYGAGDGIANVDDYMAMEQQQDDFYNVVDNNEDLYNAGIEADDWFDQFIEDMAVQQEINVAPWLDMPNDVTVTEANAKVSGTVVGYVYGSDANGDTLTYSIFDDPTGALSISGNTIIWDGTYAGVSQDTTYSVLLKVQDPYGASDVDSFQITVTADQNDPNTWVTAGDGSAGAYKQTIAYVGSGTDGRDFITELGHTVLSFNGNVASNFNGYDAIVYYNKSNGSHQNSPFYNDTRFIDWVDDGGVFVMYDRYVNDGANDTFIPGHNGNVTTVRDASGDDAAAYQIAYESTSNLLKYGPGGIMVDDTSTFGSDTAGDHSGNAHLGTFNIGGGNSTNHGYMTNLDSDVLGMATRDDTSEYVDAVWEYGAGAVYYSTTPLDHYIGAGPSANGNDAWDAYALNSLHFATSLIFDGYSQLNGTGSADKMYGTASDDVFWSKDGADEIWGGNGSDTFLYTQTYQTDPGSHDTILDFNSSEDRIDISAITNGAGISRTLTDGTLFKIDSDNNGTYEMQWELDDYTGTADDVTVIT